MVPEVAQSMTVRQAVYASTRRTKDQLLERLPRFINYDYANWRYIWMAIRHAMIGEVEIKRHAQEYLPQMEGMTDDQYRSYLDRAVFYNMVYRTVTGLTGAVFRRKPRLIKTGPKLTKLCQRISRDGLSVEVFTKLITQELLSVGRYGVLADMPRDNDSTATPYLAGYSCENILDWTSAFTDGREELDFVLLREFHIDRRMFMFEGEEAKPNKTYGQLFMSYRVLRLTYNPDTGRQEYTQEFYKRDDADADLSEEPEMITPLVHGVPMERIPFRFFNSLTSLPDIEKPPILDILTLNMSHYKTYALLEHGRFYTANPVYYVTGAQEDDEYRIGPSVVWEIGDNQKAGLIEYMGTGLKSLENALMQKETQAASLGGRLIGDSTTAGQSDNQVKLKDRNEQSLLLNVTTVTNENMTDLMHILGAWLNEKQDDDMEFRLNQDFLIDQAAAREFRAVTMMYQAGLMPIEVIYEYFLAADVIPEYVSFDTFSKMLTDAAQFPNDPDFESRQEGFPTALAQRNDELQRDLGNIPVKTTKMELDHESEQNDLDREQQQEQHQTTTASTERVAKTAIKAGMHPSGTGTPPVPKQAAQAGQRDGPPAGKPKPLAMPAKPKSK